MPSLRSEPMQRRSWYALAAMVLTITAAPFLMPAASSKNLSTVKTVRKLLQEAAGDALSGSSTAVCRLSATVYHPAVAILVTIDVMPDSSVSVVGVEDTLPRGWYAVEINEGGRLDMINNKVKWGLFFDNHPRSLSYRAVPPNAVLEDQFFNGMASFDGDDVVITGDRSLSPAYASTQPYPSTTMVPVSTTLPVATTTTSSTHPPTTLTYSTTTSSTLPVECAASRRFDPTTFTVGDWVQVVILATPPLSSYSYLIEENVPPLWTVSAVNENGIFDLLNRKVRWGPFYDHQSRQFSYAASPPPGATIPYAFTGLISIDGYNTFTCGSKEVWPSGVQATTTTTLSQPTTTTTLLPATQLLEFAQIAAGGGYRSFLVIQNLSLRAVDGVVELIQQDGQPMTLTIDGTATSRRSFHLEARGMSKLRLESNGLQPQSGWCRVIADGALSGILHYQQYFGLDIDSGASVFPSVRAARLTLPIAQLGLNSDIGIAVANPQAQVAQLTMTLLNRQGQPTGLLAGITLRPLQQIAYFISEFLPGWNQTMEGSLEISADREIIAVGLIYQIQQRTSFSTIAVSVLP